MAQRLNAENKRAQDLQSENAQMFASHESVRQQQQNRIIELEQKIEREAESFRQRAEEA